MKTKLGLTPILGSLSISQYNAPFERYIVAQVVKIILNESEGIGTIYWKKYNPVNPTNEEQNIDISSLNKALPLNPNSKIYPLKGELVLIFNLSNARVDTNKFYYSDIINIWNNPNNNQGEMFQLKRNISKENIYSLQPYSGDFILEGRFGNTIRFGSTNRENNSDNLWSNSGLEGDPILILNNDNTFSSGSKSENINNDNSSIYLTSTQNIPLITEVESNPIVKSIEPKQYTGNPQIILNSDRIIISSKKDEILLYGKTNVGLYTKKIINFDAEESVIINSPRIFLGMDNKKLPSESALLGDKTVELLNKTLEALTEFATSLSQAMSTPQGTPMVQINQAAVSLGEKIKNQITKLESLKSKKTYIS